MIIRQRPPSASGIMRVLPEDWTEEESTAVSWLQQNTTETVVETSEFQAIARYSAGIRLFAVFRKP